MSRAEFSLIDWIRRQVVDRDPVKLGIGDDAAILRSTVNRDWLLATDMLMEGTDFTFPPATARLAGRKALAVNLSDIAAMGGRATAAFVSVALPIERGVEFAKELHTGLIELADQHDVVLAGGDTNSWHGPLVINVAVVGEPVAQTSVTRRGARPGDWICVTGSLGGSIASHHLEFEPRLREVAALVNMVDVHAMIDISDGLAADLHHLLNESRVGAVIEECCLPISDAARSMNDGRSPVSHALSDGEDFELLFTVSEEDGTRLFREWQHTTPISRIGRVTAEPDCWLDRGGKIKEPLPPLGWTHVILE